ncbi:MAG: ABC transporter permease, partial [Sphaerochaetaceae bacterium]|nr:ABC transporter permease [Sphaerochaetaceae bacterium]
MLNHKNGKTKQEKATNEFNQIVVGNSLSKDAWRRLRKNKMAVISVILVSIYILLAVTAPILPIYPYDEIVIDHQDLPPSLTKTAGELMRDKELAKMYAQAWRQGRLVVDEATNEMLEDWVSRSKVNKVWDYLLPEGNRQLESGTFTWNA